MSHSPDSIPPERELAYLQHAEAEIRSASEPVLHELGKEAVGGLEWMTSEDEVATRNAPITTASAEDYANTHTETGVYTGHDLDQDMIRRLLKEHTVSSERPDIKASYGVKMEEPGGDKVSPEERQRFLDKQNTFMNHWKWAHMSPAPIEPPANERRGDSM